MSPGADRYVVLGVAHARSAWFAQLSQWATAAALPVDFVKCMSVDEVRARLASGRPFSALLADAGVAGIDRDLVDRAARVGCCTVLVDDGALRDEWAALGVVGVLPSGFDRDAVRSVLAQHATPVGTVTVAVPIEPRGTAPPVWRGRLVAVTGAGGTGTSTIARALAQGLGRDVRNRSLVLLADLALDADQAMLHDARDVVPGVQELVDAFRHGTPSAREVRDLTFGDGRPYRVLLGLRRHRDWTVLRPRAFRAALDGLRAAFTQVVADLDPDLEGEAQTGAVDLEDRNLMARTVALDADVVVVSGLAGPHGIHRLARQLRELRELGVADTRLLPVVNRAPRSPRARAEAARALAELVATSGTPPVLASPTFVGEQRRLDTAIRDGVGVPSGLATQLATAVDAVADRATVHATDGAAPAGPVPVRPGSLGAWAPDQEAAG